MRMPVDHSARGVRLICLRVLHCMSSSQPSVPPHFSSPVGTFSTLYMDKHSDSFDVLRTVRVTPPQGLCVRVRARACVCVYVCLRHLFVSRMRFPSRPCPSFTRCRVSGKRVCSHKCNSINRVITLSLSVSAFVPHFLALQSHNRASIGKRGLVRNIWYMISQELYHVSVLLCSHASIEPI